MPPARGRPASARQLYQALAELGAAPEPDPALRPTGPKPADSALLLGILLAKVELDASARASPEGNRPRGLARLLRGYTAAVSSVHDQTRLQLITYRLIRTSVETTLNNPEEPYAQAASHAALAAAHLTHAHQLSQQQDSNPTALGSALHAAQSELEAAKTLIE
ncbi:hypothetical protein AB0N88_04815 [Streptomyces sp. NPDC093516]|uniref:hypothetical protein n=1 Tax=Streptomyces sp. NPDC093516 TaxID=3155304 RepID=UPI003423D476